MEKVIKKGIVLANLITLKKGGYLSAGETITSDDINNFDELVLSGKIEVDEDSIKEYKSAQQKQAKIAQEAENKRKEKAELAKEAGAESVKLLAEATKEVETLKKENDVLKGDSSKLAEATKEVETLKKEIAELKKPATKK